MLLLQCIFHLNVTDRQPDYNKRGIRGKEYTFCETHLESHFLISLENKTMRKIIFNINCLLYVCEDSWKKAAN